ncbi:Cas8a1 family CRISPR/Cas system-associated protein [Paenibacillus terrae]
MFGQHNFPLITYTSCIPSGFLDMIATRSYCPVCYFTNKNVDKIA